MKAEPALANTASLFLALGDKTRLRLLNLMRDREVCVSSFAGVLGQSQPKISRHLAYLRNAGVVEVRRDGKWMHYSISTGLDNNSRRLLVELFKWMEGQEGLDRDRIKYDEKFGSNDKTERRRATGVKPDSPRVEHSLSERKPKRPVVRQEEAPIEDYRIVHHNELEDFLL